MVKEMKQKMQGPTQNKYIHKTIQITDQKKNCDSLFRRLGI